MPAQMRRGVPIDAPLLAGIWAAVPTPFLGDGRLDLPGIRANARHFADVLGLDGIFCNGLMGEFWSLDPAERKDALEAHIDGGGGRLRVGVVTTHHSLAETIDLSRHAARAGADHVVLMRPAAPLSHDELHDYVGAVADAAQPVVLFDSAARCGGFPPAVIRRLAQERRIAGVKCTRDADEIVALRAFCGAEVTIADPYEAHWLSNLMRFDLRALYADPEPYLFQTQEAQLIRDYYAAYQAGDTGLAASRYQRLEPLRRVYEAWIVEPLRQGRPMNAALKRWCGRMGLAAGDVRPPLRPLDAAEQTRLDRALDAGFTAVFGGAPNVAAAPEAQEWRS